MLLLVNVMPKFVDAVAMGCKLSTNAKFDANVGTYFLNLCSIFMCQAISSSYFFSKLVHLKVKGTKNVRRRECGKRKHIASIR